MHILKGRGLSGAEGHVFNLSEKLIGLGVEVSILNVLDISKGRPSGKYKERSKSVESLGADFWNLRVRSKVDFRAVGEMKRIIDQVGPDVVHTHMPYADMFGGVAAKLAGHAPVISTRHHDYLTSWTDWLQFVSYYSVADNFLDALIAVSGHVASQAKSYERWSETDVHVVYHGCKDERIPQDTSRQEVCSSLGIPDSSTIILSVGRLLDWKGHKYAVKALRHLRDANEDVCWLIAGDGPQRNPLRSLAYELGVTDSLHLLGNRDDVPTLMSAADVLVHPSTSEAFGIVIIEAMMQATPVIGSRAGAIPEIIDHRETGYLVEPADSEAISDAVCRLLEDPSKRKEMGAAARRSYLRNYTLEEMTKNTLRVYDKCLRE